MAIHATKKQWRTPLQISACTGEYSWHSMHNCWYIAVHCAMLFIWAFKIYDFFCCSYHKWVTHHSAMDLKIIFELKSGLLLAVVRWMKWPLPVKSSIRIYQGASIDPSYNIFLPLSFHLGSLMISNLIRFDLIYQRSTDSL